LLLLRKQKQGQGQQRGEKVLVQGKRARGALGLCGQGQRTGEEAWSGWKSKSSKGYDFTATYSLSEKGERVTGCNVKARHSQGERV